MKKILVTGCAGMLGSKAVSMLSDKYDVLGVDLKDFDITKEDECIKAITDYNPDIILHCAAYTAVDNAEEDREKCMLINETGSKNVAIGAEKASALMIYYSTDYVFDGTKRDAYLEDDSPNPINVYGESKLLGEERVKEIASKYAIMRITWLYGENGKNFSQTMLNLAKTRDTLTVVNDQFGSPTYTGDVVKQSEKLFDTTDYGIYHSSAEGVCSWYDVAVETFKIASVDITVKPVSSAEYPTKAKRPVNSYLENAKLKSISQNIMPPWRESLAKYIEDLQ